MTGLHQFVLPLEVKANQKSEIGNSQIVTRLVRKRASGRALPPCLRRSFLKKYVCGELADVREQLAKPTYLDGHEKERDCGTDCEVQIREGCTNVG